MSSTGQDILSASVVLQPASGRTIDGSSQITSENVREYMPSSGAVSEAARFFAGVGFTVGPVGATGFSITAPRETFEQVFGTRLREDERGGFEAAHAGGSSSPELPLDRLPTDVAGLVQAVTFTPPPDFGPTGWY